MPNYYISPESAFDATADAIRAKTGSQAPIAWTEDGFADAVADIPTGGSGIQSGSFVLASNSKTFTISLNGIVSYLVFYDSDYPNGTADAGWHVVGGSWMNGYLSCVMRYNEANTSVTSGSVAVTSGSLTVSGLGYNMLAGKTFYWYAW